MKSQFKQAIDISAQIQDIFNQVFAILNTNHEVEIEELTEQLKGSIKKVINIFCRQLGDNDSELKTLFTQLYEMIEAENIDKEMVDNLLHRINVMCISEILKEEEDFSNYIDCLQMVCKSGISIFITVCDTPCGSPDFTYAMGEKLCQLGLNVNLSTKFRASYCAVIDGKKNLEEKISEISPLTINCKLGQSVI